MNKTMNITSIIVQETAGISYKSIKYSLDNDRSVLEYNEEDDKTFTWKRSGETNPPNGYQDLKSLVETINNKNLQIFSYFIDGSRRVFKVDDIAFWVSGKRKVIYPIVAGQIGVGVCKRENKKIFKEILHMEIIITLPEIANADGKDGFLESLSLKIENNSSFSQLKKFGWNKLTVLKYDVKKNERKFEDRGAAVIQSTMIEREKSIVKQLVRANKLGAKNYLIKDGSLEYKLKKSDKDDEKSFKTFLNNYNWVIGISKRPNPEACFKNQKSDPGYLADIPPFSRTAVAYFTTENEELSFAVWYVRVREKNYSRSPFDGIVKVEKFLVGEKEIRYGMDSEDVDMISAMIINERFPTCYGSDVRWANHLYPIYLTETFVKSHYLNAESFYHLF